MLAQGIPSFVREEARETPPAARRNEDYALFPLQPDEVTTCDAMLMHAGTRLLVSPNHHINSFQVRPACPDPPARTPSLTRPPARRA